MKMKISREETPVKRKKELLGIGAKCVSSKIMVLWHSFFLNAMVLIQFKKDEKATYNFENRRGTLHLQIILIITTLILAKGGDRPL
jgi:hypothetical protein